MTYLADYLNALTSTELTEVRAALNGVDRARILAQSSTQVNHTGTVNETTLATVAIAANTIAAGDILRLTSFWKMPNNANNKTYRWILGGTSGDRILNSTLTTQVLFQPMNLVYFPTASSQVGINASNQNGLGASTSSEFTGTRNMTQAQDLVLTCTLGVNTDTVNLLGYLVELIKA